MQLPASAYSEVEGTFINMEGRVRVAENPLRSLGEERPMWKVMMRLVQALGYDIPAINLDEVREKVLESAPSCVALKDVWLEKNIKSVFIPSARNRGAILPDMANLNAAKSLDVVGRYSMYREGAWARASDLLSEAGCIHALDDLIVHPATLAGLGLEQGELTVASSTGVEIFRVGTREDVSPGVLFVAKRGVAGDLSGESSIDLQGGQS